MKTYLDMCKAQLLQITKDHMKKGSQLELQQLAFINQHYNNRETNYQASKQVFISCSIVHSPCSLIKNGKYAKELVSKYDLRT